MLFCIGEGKCESRGIGYQKNYHIFNVPVSKDVYDKAISLRPSFTLPLIKWIDKKDMTDEDAWKEGWANASNDFKDWVKNLPNFDAKIFEEITGIDTTQCEAVKSGDEIEVCIADKLVAEVYNHALQDALKVWEDTEDETFEEELNKLKK